jgi:hypothetical protein
MGLDTVELVMRIEETFGIEIPDRVASTLYTPRDVMDFILTQVEVSEAPLPCLSQRAFHRLRSAFAETLALPWREIRPHTARAELLPEKNRVLIWKQLRNSVAAEKWPPLTRSRWNPFGPDAARHIKDLVDFLVTNYPLLLKGSQTAWSRSQVRDVLWRVITDETGVKDFSENTRFVDDMGLD